MTDKWRAYVDSLLLVAAGILAMASFITAKKPDAKKLLDKLAPYQGIIGVILLVMGIWDLFFLLTNLGAITLMRHIPSAFPGAWKFHLLGYIFYFLGIVEIGLGFLLGFGLIVSKMGSKSPEMAAKGENLQKKLAGYQVPLGGFGAVIGLLLLFVVITL